MSKSVLDPLVAVVVPVIATTPAPARHGAALPPSRAASELDYLLAAEGPGLTPEHRETAAELERRWLSLGPEQLARVRALILGGTEGGQASD